MGSAMARIFAHYAYRRCFNDHIHTHAPVATHGLVRLDADHDTHYHDRGGDENAEPARVPHDLCLGRVSDGTHARSNLQWRDSTHRSNTQGTSSRRGCQCFHRVSAHSRYIRCHGGTSSILCQCGGGRGREGETADGGLHRDGTEGLQRDGCVSGKGGSDANA